MNVHKNISGNSRWWRSRSTLYKAHNHRKTNMHITKTRMWDMSVLFTQGNMTPERCEFLCCHGYSSTVTCYPCDLTGSSGRNHLN